MKHSSGFIVMLMCAFEVARDLGFIAAVGGRE
jgi:predicted RND superfamily exporter protein